MNKDAITRCFRCIWTKTGAVDSRRTLKQRDFELRQVLRERASLLSEVVRLREENTRLKRESALYQARLVALRSTVNGVMEFEALGI